jgi:hypothetical protein
MAENADGGAPGRRPTNPEVAGIVTLLVSIDGSTIFGWTDIDHFGEPFRNEPWITFAVMIQTPVTLHFATISSPRYQRRRRVSINLSQNP